MSDDLTEALSKADKAVADGQFDLAEDLCREILKNEEDNLSALLLLGVISFKSGRIGDALPLFEKACATSPDSEQAHLWNSRVLRKLERGAEALSQASQAANLNRTGPAIQHQLGLCCLDAKKYPEAVASFQQAIASDPNAAPIHTGLRLAFLGLGQRSRAIDSFERSVKLSPSSVQTLKTLRQTLADADESARALECSLAIVRLRPNSGEAHLVLAMDLLDNNKESAAESSLLAAIRLGCESPAGTDRLGSVLQGLGRFEEADVQFRRSIASNPRQGSAYLDWARNAPVTEAQRDMVDQMSRIATTGNLPPEQDALLRFALGKALEDLGQYEEATFHYDEANRIGRNVKFGDKRFNKELYAQRMDRLIQTFDEPFFKNHSGIGSNSDQPIFVVGMIRSGTTLVTQILSSHPDIGSAGEQRYWPKHSPTLLERTGLTSWAEELNGLLDPYLSILREAAPDRRRVIDKMPDNYRLLPLLHLAFPKAKFIHTIRNPADTCLSIYTTANRLKNDWAYDKEDIAFVYRQYLRTMDHWRRLLPKGTFLDVRYQEMVTDCEKVTRDILQFVGMDWNDACLRPEQNKQAVNTPSVWQVRQPVYATSVDRWRRFEAWVKPFFRLLQDSALDIPSALAQVDRLHSEGRALLLQARCLLLDNRAEEAENCVNAAIKLGSLTGPSSYQIGIVLQGLGRIREAETYFRRSIEIDPRQGAAYAFLSYIRTTGDADRLIVERMRELSEDLLLSPGQRSLLHYGLGKSFEDFLEYGTAMFHFNEANKLAYDEKFGRIAFDRQTFIARNDQMIEAYATETPNRLRSAGLATNMPIFVVGMIRSGTTLVEQILSSHPEIGSAGEQSFWIENGPDLAVHKEKLRDVAQEYLARLKRIAPGNKRVVDKMPMNYAAIPLIHRAYPNAKIIHVKRNPLDTCLSIYTTINPAKIEWMHKKENIVLAYRNYQRMMNHWRIVIPGAAMMEIDYEQLVFKPEEATRQMIEFCGLEWDEACLRPQDNRRTVSTPSVWQVRQPVYNTSVGRWRKYEPWLGEFAELLKDSHLPSG